MEKHWVLDITSTCKRCGRIEQDGIPNRCPECNYTDFIVRDSYGIHNSFYDMVLAYRKRSRVPEKIKNAEEEVAKVGALEDFRERIGWEDFA